MPSSNKWNQDKYGNVLLILDLAPKNNKLKLSTLYLNKWINIHLLSINIVQYLHHKFYVETTLINSMLKYKTPSNF